ncbi:MAG: restriction endonuclease subunit S [Verrucomicrobiota bacterium JB023]|nr:restriction endonuclease subunit S [Verrucomicrobiota bacterium JB023]
MTTFPRYDRYKDSGVEWLGEIPEHWKLLPGRVTLSLNKEKNTGNIEDTVLSLSYGRLVIKPPEKLTGLVPESFESYQIINPGDIVIRPTDLQNDWTSLRVGLAKNRGIITSAYLGLKHDDKVSSEYLYYLLHSYDLLKVYYGMGTGLRQNLDWRDFKYLPLSIPPKPEQDRIVTFLDRKTAEIDALIAKKQRQIELLDEQKAILINRAVTRGLNPNAKLKPSGIEWIGDIPEHWEIPKFLYLCLSIRDGTHNPPPATEGLHRLLSVRNIQEGRFFTREDDRKMSAREFKILQRSYTVEPGDVVIALVGGTTGKSAVVEIDTAEISVQRSLGILRPNPKKVDSHFLNYAIQNRATQKVIWELATKYAAQPGIYLDDLGRLRIPTPPLEEQKEVVAHCNQLAANSHKAAKKISDEIESLKTLRSTLIAHAVTGRIKV